MSTKYLHGKDNYSLSFGPNDVRITPSFDFKATQDFIVASVSIALTFIKTSISRVFMKKTTKTTCTVFGKGNSISKGQVTPIIDTSCGSFALTLPNEWDDIMIGRTYRIEHTEGIMNSHGCIRSITLV